ncbi:RBBP9/YdeN family alpha/beta hydrolase [Stagnihabitans tardus]|uniref:Alpha/beta fold hydrolase n=1 Tax=Stagnihabitans tardus TaxID=2699202 RepID=A0AAE4Y939_9RHOB|nr:alpha/beta fold hydrolase [Stagnihabitans tardus]NBZ88288.1 alpha/beta fold hydrolase [Stagnihabitans tardus]
MTTTLIIPGLDGSREGHWQQWWLDSDSTARPVLLTELYNPVPQAWEVELVSAILDHPGAILVGHSLGAVLIARVLAQWPHLDVKGALLVAPAEDPSHPRAKPFTPLPELSLRRPATVVASRNDPWMRHDRARELARHWQARFVDLGRAGHVNIEAGFGPWPLGLALRDDLVERAARGESNTRAWGVESALAAPLL